MKQASDSQKSDRIQRFVYEPLKALFDNFLAYETFIPVKALSVQVYLDGLPMRRVHFGMDVGDAALNRFVKFSVSSSDR